MSFVLVFYPYCGNSDIMAEGTQSECRDKAAKRIRRHRNEFNYPVTTIEYGKEWELESDPDGMHMVSDFEGILAINEISDPPDDDCEEAEDEPKCCEDCMAVLVTHPEFCSGKCEDCMDDEDDKEDE